MSVPLTVIFFMLSSLIGCITLSLTLGFFKFFQKALKNPNNIPFWVLNVQEGSAWKKESALAQITLKIKNKKKRKRNTYLVPGGLQTGPPWPCRSPALDTPRWQTAGSSGRHIWCPTLRFSTPPLCPRLRWPHRGDGPTVAEDEGGKKKRRHCKTTFFRK